MSIGYRIDKSQGLTIGVWHGAVTNEEIADGTARLFADADWPPPGKKHLTDLTSVSSTPDLVELAEVHKASGLARGIRLAVVATDSFDEARKYEHAVASAGLVVIVFTQTATACSWLGVDYAPAQGVINEIRQELRGRSTAPA